VPFRQQFVSRGLIWQDFDADRIPIDFRKRFQECYLWHDANQGIKLALPTPSDTVS
jgi:hypothetical protein